MWRKEIKKYGAKQKETKISRRLIERKRKKRDTESRGRGG